ncbi:MAG: hypothetical protein H5T76_10605 [Streptomyces sp.]|nr:hypothetical protein [Streptomyces sp.]
MNVRLLALAGVAACAVALPLAMASAGPVGDRDHPAAQRDHTVVRPDSTVLVQDHSVFVRPDRSPPGDAKGAVAATASPLTLGLGLATAARCGPELTSPEGVEAQTCVLTQGEETWGRTYYRNATGGALDAVLSLMGPDDRTVRMNCAVGAEDAPATCDTPRGRDTGRPADYTAVTEFAEPGGAGRLLLRSGSNSGNFHNSGAPTRG